MVDERLSIELWSWIRARENERWVTTTVVFILEQASVWQHKEGGG